MARLPAPFALLSAVLWVASGGVATAASPVLRSAFTSYPFDPQAAPPVRVADLDHAGTPEIVSGAVDTHTHIGSIIVSKFVSNRWQRVQTISTPDGITDFVLSDVNHDGFPDLVYLSEGSPYARVCDGAGGFGAPQPIAGTGTPPNDFTSFLIRCKRSGTGDEFLALRASGSFEIFRDSVEPNGTHDYVVMGHADNVGLLTNFIDNGAPYDLPPFAAEADLNGDGIPDVAAFAEPDLPNGTRPGVRLFMGTGNGAYASPVDIYLDDRYDRAEFIYATDVDGDGDTDLIVGQEDMELAVLTNDGAGNFTQTVSTPPYFGPTDDPTVHGRPVDVNGDGRADYMLEIIDHLNLALVMDLQGALLHALPTGIYPYGLETGDLDGDGAPDLVVLNLATPVTLDVFPGRGGAQFGDTVQTVTLPESPVGVAVGDLDADGTPDLALVGFTDVTTVRSSQPALVTPYALPAGAPATAVAVGVGVAAQPAATEVVTTLSTAQPGRFPCLAGGALDAPVLFDGLTQEEVVVATGDLNGDHRYDIAAAMQVGGRDSVIVWLSTPTGFQPPAEYAVGPYVQGIAIADMNGDGAPDIVTTASQPGSVSVLLNQGNGTMGAATDYLLPAGLTPSSIAVGSLVGADEYPDVAVSIPDANEVYVLQGNGLGGLTSLGAFPVGTGPVVVREGDINADGHMDLVTANTAGNTVSVLAGTLVGSTHSLADAVSYGACAAPKDIALGNFTHHLDGKLDVIAIGPRSIPSFMAAVGATHPARALVAPAAPGMTRPARTQTASEWDLFYMPSVSTGPTSVPETTPAASVELSVAPNPAHGAAQLTFSLPRGGHAAVDVFDLAGRRVVRLADAAFAAGVHRVAWDGRDGAGGCVGPGVLFVRVRTAQGTVTRRLAWLR
jgi:hypothetical protein